MYRQNHFRGNRHWNDDDHRYNRPNYQDFDRQNNYGSWRRAGSTNEYNNRDDNYRDSNRYDYPEDDVHHESNHQDRMYHNERRRHYNDYDSYNPGDFRESENGYEEDNRRYYSQRNHGYENNNDRFRDDYRAYSDEYPYEHSLEGDNNNHDFRDHRNRYRGDYHGYFGEHPYEHSLEREDEDHDYGRNFFGHSGSHIRDTSYGRQPEHPYKSNNRIRYEERRRRNRHIPFSTKEYPDTWSNAYIPISQY
jgi:hypothetical protein